MKSQSMPKELSMSGRKSEIEDSLGDDAQIFAFHYGVIANGNAPTASDPQGEFRGKNILIERHGVAETAKHFGKSEDEIRTSLKKSRHVLFKRRSKRPRPHLDDKIITAWNGLMISAFARGAQVLGDSDYLDSAKRALQFLRANLYDESTKTLRRNFREGKGTVAGFAEDYAFVIQACSIFTKPISIFAGCSSRSSCNRRWTKLSSTKRVADISARAARTKVCCCE
jgi:uncharacterized protein YyaL (SSP411 family)